MAASSPSLEYRRLRAPSHDGGLLLEPDWQECQALAARNRSRFEEYDFELSGRSFQGLRHAFRRELLSLARAYTSEYSTELPDRRASDQADEQPIIMSGHQPRLFHPGVWAKNFAVAKLAREVQGVAIHVIIDNDTMREHSLRIPTGTKQSPRVALEPFDLHADPTPFESRYAIDRDLLRSFPKRVTEQISNIISKPIIGEIWPDVLSAVDRGKPLGWAFAESRHKLETRWGHRTLEVPLSQLCQTETFRWFVFSMLSRGQELTESYNRRLQQYRDVHRLRSAAQPLPDLRSKPTDDARQSWNEAPFWTLGHGMPGDDNGRRSLWWQRRGDDLLLSDERLQRSWTIPDALSTPEKGFARFQELCVSELSIRPRALTNTMLLRLFGSDVFIHGIGGAKYDQVTDLILSDLFCRRTVFDPPEYIALSETVLLPTGVDLVTTEECASQRQQLREIFFHPERFLSEAQERDDQVSCLVEKKSKLVRLQLPRGQRAERHLQIAQCNAKLRVYLQEKTEILQKTLVETESRLGASRILGSREWSSILFPAEHLRNRLLERKSTSP